MHDIIIIIDKAGCLQGANVTGEGKLETLKAQATTADYFVNNTVALDEATEIRIADTHQWLEDVQDALTVACANLGALTDECPNV